MCPQQVNQEAEMYQEERGLGIWFKDGIENILLAIDEANLDMVSRFDAPEVRIYRQGFAAAISAVATAFGIRYASPRTIPAQTANIPDLPVQECRES
jgi:hypothetical protein